MTRIIYDPEAAPEKRWVYECSFLVSPGETPSDIETLLEL